MKDQIVTMSPSSIEAIHGAAEDIRSVRVFWETNAGYVGHISGLFVNSHTGEIVSARVICWSRFHTRRSTFWIPWRCLVFDGSAHAFRVKEHAECLGAASVVLGDDALWPERDTPKGRDEWGDPPHWGL
jgi:hypothetical protein